MISNQKPLDSSSNHNSTNHPYVYIHSKKYAWVPGRLLHVNHDTMEATVRIQYHDHHTRSNDEETSNRIKVHNNKINRTRQINQFNKNNSNNKNRLSDEMKNDSIVIVSLYDYPNHVLPMQNINPITGQIHIVDDMVLLNYIHEASILYNIQQRHCNSTTKSSQPYTRTCGYNVMIAVNPYQWIHSLYTHQQQELYYQYCCSSLSPMMNTSSNDTSNHTSVSLPPHIYEISSMAYYQLRTNHINQSILVSGESGAGKTETVKLCLHHLANISTTTKQQHSDTTTHHNSNSSIIKRVIDCHPLLEAFGNAMTSKNDNSSRFGKYIQLQFNSTSSNKYQLCGSICHVYLLEKCRIIGNYNHHLSTTNERNYHIFYQLLSASDTIKASIWDGLVNTTNESFQYIGYSKVNTIEGRTDHDHFQQTMQSLQLLGISNDKMIHLFRCLCMVLQLGNIKFATSLNNDSVQNGEQSCTVSNMQEIGKLCQLMGITNIQQMSNAMTYRTITARNELMKVPISLEHAKDACDAFAKEIYHTTFLWLVQQINVATSNSDPNLQFGTIGLLDIFGFESYTSSNNEVTSKNGFEQLCINYANEMLQQKFTQDIFTTVMEEYQNEGIELCDVEYHDNCNVLQLIEGKTGILAMLNEESFRPNGNDTSFVRKVISCNHEHPSLYMEKLYTDYQFGINHYAGTVLYDAKHFVMKNMDHIPHDLIEIAKKCNNPILANHLQLNVTNIDKHPHGKNSHSLVGITVWTKFKTQLHALMRQIRDTQTRYIRCIKPNNIKAPKIMDHVSTIQQLRCAGIVAAVTISRSAFPNRLHHEKVLDQFHFLWPKGNGSIIQRCQHGSFDERNKVDVEILLSNALKDFVYEDKHASQENEMTNIHRKARPFAIGHTRVYFRNDAFEFLESQRLNGMNMWATEIQKVVRGYQQKRKYRLFNSAIVVMQKQYRCKQEQLSYIKARQNVILLQNLYRTIVAKRRAASLHKFKKAAVSIQRITRGFIQRPKYQRAVEAKKNQYNVSYQLELMKEQMKADEDSRKLEYEREQEKIRQQIENDQKNELEHLQRQIAIEEGLRQAATDREQELAKKLVEEEKLRKIEEQRVAMELEILKRKIKEDEERHRAEYDRQQELLRTKMEEDTVNRLEQMKRQIAEEEERRQIYFKQQQDLLQKTMLDKRLKDLEHERNEMHQQIQLLRNEKSLLINETIRLKTEVEILEEKSRSPSPHSVVEPDVRVVEVVKYVEKEVQSNAISEEQQGLMEESSKIIEFLRNENVKLKKKLEQQKKDFATLKENNQRLMEANSSAGASFAALNQHAKQLNTTNQKLLKGVAQYRNKITQINADVKERQSYYREIATAYKVESEVRIYYEKAMMEMADIVANYHRQNRKNPSYDPKMYKFLSSKAVACAKMSQTLLSGDRDNMSIINEPEPAPLTSIELFNEDELGENQIYI